METVRKTSTDGRAQGKKRILGRLLARELTDAELGTITGARPSEHFTCCMGDGVVYCFDDCG